MKLMMILSIMFYSTQHPIIMLVILIILTLIMSLYMSLILKTTWIPLIIILVMLGGMLILFMYIASLSPNEIFLKNKAFFIIPPIMLMPLQNSNFITHQFNMNIWYKLFDSISMMTTILTLLYLLLSLIVIMNILKVVKAPVRSN
uniref:NADH dehydrogenase subunit 6 n=1 Tax=Microdiplogynium sp. XFX TaxID=2695875 RepID=A0A6B9WD81_9ACAR|nr:NADH dehydrogenase subunit 6 [Microdiplogynium sp. XFX]